MEKPDFIRSIYGVLGDQYTVYSDHINWVIIKVLNNALSKRFATIQGHNVECIDIKV